ncbi:MAG: hypothetical protein ACFFCO_10005, partial [Promethearchaeota archaeon]
MRLSEKERTAFQQQLKTELKAAQKWAKDFAQTLNQEDRESFMEALLHRKYKNPFRMPTQLIATEVIREGTPRSTMVIYSDPTRDNVEIQVLDTMQEREFNALIKQLTTNPKIDRRVIWVISPMPLKWNIPLPRGYLH